MGKYKSRGHREGLRPLFFLPFSSKFIYFNVKIFSLNTLRFCKMNIFQRTACCLSPVSPKVAEKIILFDKMLYYIRFLVFWTLFLKSHLQQFLNLFLHSKNLLGMSYIETKNLDGETNLKHKKVNRELAFLENMSDEDVN